MDDHVSTDHLTAAASMVGWDDESSSDVDYEGGNGGNMGLGMGNYLPVDLTYLASLTGWSQHQQQRSNNVDGWDDDDSNASRCCGRNPHTHSHHLSDIYLHTRPSTLVNIIYFMLPLLICF